MSYYRAPAGVLEDRDALARWAGEALAAGRRAQAKKAGKPKV